MRRRKKPERPKKEFGSIAFYLSIPLLYFSGFLFFLASFILFHNTNLVRVEFVWGMLGFFLGLLITPLIHRASFGVFVHELKHAVLVILFGGKIKEFAFARSGGHVSHVLPSDGVQMRPFIQLAPYCFPLISSAVLIAWACWGFEHVKEFEFLLGVSAAYDIRSGLIELHPRQTDISRLIGGIFVAGTYIGGFLFMWANFVALWMFGAKDGFLFGVREAVALVVKVLYQKIQ